MSAIPDDSEPVIQRVARTRKPAALPFIAHLRTTEVVDENGVPVDVSDDDDSSDEDAELDAQKPLAGQDDNDEEDDEKDAYVPSDDEEAEDPEDDDAPVDAEVEVEVAGGGSDTMDLAEESGSTTSGSHSNDGSDEDDEDDPEDAMDE